VNWPFGTSRGFHLRWGQLNVLALQQAISNGDRKHQHDAIVLGRQMVHLVEDDILDLIGPVLQT